MSKFLLLVSISYFINNFPMDNGHDALQNEAIISIVCNGPHTIFDCYHFPLPHLKLSPGTQARSSKGWPIRGGLIDKGTYTLDRNKPVELTELSSRIAQKIDGILPATLFEEEHSPSYKTNTPEDLFYIAVDLKNRESLTPNKIHAIYNTLGFEKELEPKSRGLQIACDPFPSLEKLKKMKIPIVVYGNIMQLPQKILIRLKEYITNAYYRYTGFDELVMGSFTRSDELRKWIIDSDSDKEVCEWIKKYNLCNKLYFKKSFSNDQHHPEIYTMVNPKVDSIWNIIEPVASKGKNNHMINKLYTYLEILTMWEVFRNINRIQRSHCAAIG